MAKPDNPSTHTPELAPPSSLDHDDDAWFARLRAADPILRTGSFGPYELLAEIGRGGQGVVYKARQPGTGRVIAVKRVCAAGAGSASFRLRFEREIRTAAALNHPNIVTVFGCDTVDGQALLLMEFIDGPPVDRWVESLGPPGEPRRTAAVVTLFERLCRAVAHAHQHGVIHRDLKPSNVLVSVGAVSDRDSSTSRSETAPTAQPKVLDFGLARLLSPYVTDSLLETHTTGFVGTPAYASPEHFADDGAAVDVRSDIYAVGVMLYQALTGSLPYDGKSSPESLVDSGS